MENLNTDAINQATNAEVQEMEKRKATTTRKIRDKTRDAVSSTMSFEDEEDVSKAA